jgi:PAS domain S-box-containing protein
VQTRNAEWPVGAGEMARRIRAYDWASSPLGASETWPQSLKTAVDLLLASCHAMMLAWGPERTLLYNDAYAPMLGGFHPRAIGVPFRQAWPDIWAEIEPLAERVFAGETVRYEALPLVMQRHGYPEDTWWNFSCSPVRDESGAIAGLLIVTVDATPTVRGERAERERDEANTLLQREAKRHEFLLRLSDALRPLADAAEIQATTARLLGAHLGVDRAMYAEVEGEPGAERGTIRGQYVRPASGGKPAVAPFPERFTYRPFGADTMAGRYGGDLLVVADVQADPGFDGQERAAWAAAGVRAAIVAPLAKAGRLVAEFGIHCTGPRPWTDAEMSLVREVAERTWAAAERARAEKELRESEEQHRAELERQVRARTAELQQSRDLLRATMDSSLDMIQVFEAIRDEQGTIVDFRWVLNNHTSETRFGEVRGESLLQRNPGVVEEGIFDAFKRVVETGEPVVAERHYAHEQFNGWFFQSAVKLGDGVATTTKDITGWKQAQEEVLRLRDEVARTALRESEEKFRKLFDSIDEGLAIVEMVHDNDGGIADMVFRQVNRSYERQGGVADVVDRSIFEVLPGVEEHWLDAFRQVAKTGEALRVENYQQHVGRWFDVYFSRVDDAGRFVATVFNDISERKRAEQVLRERDERHAYLLRLSDALRPLADPVEIIGAATRLLGEGLGASRAYYAEWPPGTDYVDIRRDYAAPGLPSLVGRYPIEFFRATDQLFRQGRTRVVEDVADGTIPAAERDYCLAHGVAAWIDVPLVKGGKLQGALFLVEGAPRCWNATEIALAEETAERTWAAIERARAEAALHESEAKLRTALSISTVGVMFWSEEGTLQETNDAFLRMTGFTREEVLGKTWDELTPPEFRPRSAAFVEELRATGEATPYEKQYFRRDGSRWWGLFTARQLSDGFVEFALDVTARREAEAALRESEEQFRRAVEEAPIPVIMHAEDGQVLQISRTWTDLTGFRPEDIPTFEAWLNDAYGEGADAVRTHMHELFAGSRRSVDIEFPIRTCTGEQRHWSFSASSPGMLRDGRRFIVGMAVDITERARAEKELRESEERLRQFGEASQDILWIRDAATLQWTYLTPAFETIYGLSREAALSGDNYRTWLDLILPEDRSMAIDAIERVKTGEHITFDYRIQRPSDGAVRWLRNTDFPIANAAGEITLVGGIGHDFTEMRDTELRLQTLIEGIPQLVWRAIGDGQWTWASPQWTEYTGQSQAHSRGQGWLEALHPEDRTAARHAWAHAAETGGFEVEYRLCRRKTQEYRWFQTRATPVRGQAGEVVEWLGTSTDIHELRELQERQQVLVAELQHRTRNLMGVIRSIAEKTASSSADLADFGERFGDRLDALARVQGLLSRLNEHDRVTFDQLLATEVSALDGSGERVALNGPTGIRLRSSTVQTLALALHELFTNAIKYGALHQPSGLLTVHWSLEPADGNGPPWLHIDWRETGVALPRPDSKPERRGHGRELIERALPYQLKARTHYELRPGGVHCTISLPVSQTTESNEFTGA